MPSDSTRFRRPPVLETVLGGQFETLPRFRNAHLGAFWKTLGTDWPQVADAPRLENVFEVFGKGARLSGIPQVRFSQDPSARLQIKSSQGNRMIQVQNGRFHYNWIGQKTAERYPGYDKVFADFCQFLERFRGFLIEESLGELEFNQWELTYVNHIPKGTLWNTPAEWSQIFAPGMVQIVSPTNVTLETINATMQCEIPAERGRLYIRLQHGSEKSVDVLILSLMARGPIIEGDRLEDALNLGHETIVRAFCDVTSRKAHDFWGLSNA